MPSYSDVRQSMKFKHPGTASYLMASSTVVPHQPWYITAHYFIFKKLSLRQGSGLPGALASLTHWGRYKMDAISQTTFSSAFLEWRCLNSDRKFHWSVFLRVQLTIFHHWFGLWFGAVQAPSHYLNQVYWRIYASLGLNELITDDLAIGHKSIEIRYVLYECNWELSNKFT